MRESQICRFPYYNLIEKLCHYIGCFTTSLLLFFTWRLYELFLWSLIRINQSIVCRETSSSFRNVAKRGQSADNYTFHHPCTKWKRIFLKGTREFECTCCARTRLSSAFIVRTKYAQKCECTSHVFRIHHTRAQQIARLTRAKIWLCTGCRYDNARLRTTCYHIGLADDGFSVSFDTLQVYLQYH